VNRRPNYQDISWFLDLRRNKQLDLTPPYQRRSVWTRKDRAFFLDTIFRNYPSPAIFLDKTISEGGKATFHVVDGKQRLETIFMFVDDGIRIPKDFGDASLDGKKWSDLATEPTLKTRFWNYVLPVEYIDTSEGRIVEEVFDRLNRNSRKLERQELRHAKFDGWLIDLAEAESEKDEWDEWKVSTMARVRRMKDVQFISELLLVLIEKKPLGFDQDVLDEKYGEYETPSENKPSFSESAVARELKKVKKLVGELESLHECVTKHARSFNTFYTLWCLVCLDGASWKAEDLSKRYAHFMKKVEKLESAPNLDEVTAGGEKGQYAHAFTYLQNSRGASTDLLQRQARLDALRAGLKEVK
jgi:hypothetical protein